MPSLRALHAKDFVPEFDTIVPTQLTTCVLFLGFMGTPFAGGGWETESIVEFLGSLTALEDLAFTLEHQAFDPEDFQAQMPSLSRLSLKFGLSGVDSIKSFFHAFRCPNVLSLAIDAALPVASLPGVSICALLGLIRKVPSALDFSIIVRHEIDESNDWSYVGELVNLVSNGDDYLDKLANLRLEYAFGADDEGFFNFSKEVRRLDIENCPGSINKILKVLGDVFKKPVKGNTENGRSLRIQKEDVGTWIGDNVTS